MTHSQSKTRRALDSSTIITTSADSMSFFAFKQTFLASDFKSGMLLVSFLGIQQPCKITF
jgi:hypothetical protein